MTHDTLTESVVDRVGRLLHVHVGLRPDPSLLGRLRRCIRDDSQALGLDPDTYVALLQGGGNALQSLVNRVTVQETGFFRHPEHFEVLAANILPNLTPPVTVWSAACANGQEAFSLAMVLDEQGIEGEVIASDLSTDALNRTRTALYTTREVSGLSTERRARHLTAQGDMWRVNAALQQRVTTVHHNLLDPVPDRARASQVIFCRNVLIYLSPEHVSSFLDRMAEAIPSASLFLGAAEAIWQVSDRYETVRADGTFSYRPRPDSASSTPQQSVAVALPGTRTRRDRRSMVSAPSRRRTAAPAPAPTAVPGLVLDPGVTLRVAEAGQRASAAGDAQSAVIAFRQCVYLTPRDPLAHLHLGLALDAAGDQPAAQRAYAAARRALLESDPSQIEHATEGYTVADLFRLLDSKQEVARP